MLFILCICIVSFLQACFRRTSVYEAKDPTKVVPTMFNSSRRRSVSKAARNKKRSNSGDNNNSVAADIEAFKKLIKGHHENTRKRLNSVESDVTNNNRLHLSSEDSFPASIPNSRFASENSNSGSNRDRVLSNESVSGKLRASPIRERLESGDSEVSGEAGNRDRKGSADSDVELDRSTPFARSRYDSMDQVPYSTKIPFASIKEVDVSDSIPAVIKPSPSDEQSSSPFASLFNMVYSPSISRSESFVKS